MAGETINNTLPVYYIVTAARLPTFFVLCFLLRPQWASLILVGGMHAIA